LGRALSGRVQRLGFGTAAADIVRVPGCRIDKDTNGVEAVALATRTRYNLILMDLSMPELDGPEATKRLRAAGASKTSRIVALTAHVMPEMTGRMLDARLDEFLPGTGAKPRGGRGETAGFNDFHEHAFGCQPVHLLSAAPDRRGVRPA
jgi:CheY-like chemotaxis protein